MTPAAGPPGDWAIEPAPITGGDARTLLADYEAELVQRIPDFALAGAAPPGPHDFDPPHGVFLVGTVQGRAAACGALKALAPGVGEVRRMYVRPEHRGRGLGRRVLEELEAHARRLALLELRLDTSSVLVEATSLYRAAGFVPMDAYNDNRFADHWLVKHLEP
jgi:GNAT superfamily N-acetyltransferase